MNVGRRTFIKALFGRVWGSVGCVVLALTAFSGQAAAFAGRITIESGGITRTAILVEHERLKRARRPIVIVLHGGSGNGARIRHILGLEDLARSHGPVMIYPDAVGGHWSDTPGPAANRDAVFIHDLINKLVTDGIADRHKVFLVGSSTGGMMAMRLACDGGEVFTAVAAVIAAMPADLASTCKPPRPLPFMLIVGTADPLVPYHGGKTNISDSKVEVLSAEATIGVFAKLAGCGEGKATTAFPDRDPKDGTRAYLDKLEGCKVPVEEVRIEGGGHTLPGRWSGARTGLGAHNSDVDTAKLIADFFRGFSG